MNNTTKLKACLLLATLGIAMIISKAQACNPSDVPSVYSSCQKQERAEETIRNQEMREMEQQMRTDGHNAQQQSQWDRNAQESQREQDRLPDVL